MMKDWKFDLLEEIISVPGAEISISSPRPRSWDLGTDG